VWGNLCGGGVWLGGGGGGGGGGDDVMSAVLYCRPAGLPRAIVKPVLFVNSTQCCVVERK